MNKLIVFTISTMFIYLYGCEPGLKWGEKYTEFPDGSVPCPTEKIIYYNLSNDTVSLKIQVNPNCTGGSIPFLKIYTITAGTESGTLSEIQLNKTGKTDTIIYAPPNVKVGLLCPGFIDAAGSCSYKIYPAGLKDFSTTDSTRCASYGNNYSINDTSKYITFMFDKICGEVSAKFYVVNDSIPILLKSFEFNDINIGSTLMVTLPSIKSTYLTIKCGDKNIPAFCFISRTLRKL